MLVADCLEALGFQALPHNTKPQATRPPPLGSELGWRDKAMMQPAIRCGLDGGPTEHSSEHDYVTYERGYL